MRVAVSIFACLCALGGTLAEEPKKAPAKKKPTPEVRAALERLKLPGVEINLDERCVDVASEVCLDKGMLELVACTRDSKEHESIVAIGAKAMHIHTALLLLGAKAGSPAMRKQVGDKEERWVDVPPSGGAVDVSLVFKDKKGKLVERPISDFIEPADPASAEREKMAGEKHKFPTNTFLFAGSVLVANGAGPRTYMSDRDGNVISIATFGDELLCLPEVHTHANGSLRWQVDRTHLPKVGAKVTLRLRPKVKK